jgi:ABC-type phosphate transport system permease subunit
MIEMFLLSTFHLYVTIFQQHLHMEYIYLSVDMILQSWCFISQFHYIGILTTRWDPTVKVEVITSSFMVAIMIWFTVNVTDDNEYVSFVSITSFFPFSWFILEHHRDLLHWGATSRAGTSDPSGAPAFLSNF